MIYVVIPAHKPRLKDLLACIAHADGPELSYVVVTNDPTPIEHEDLYVLDFEADRVHILKDNDPSINLARWYNIGVNWSQVLDAHDDWVGHRRAIFYMESDVRITYDAILELEEELHAHGVSQIGPNFWALPRGHADLGTRNTLGYVYPPYRVCQASMVPMSSAHRMDEQFRWWMEADDLEWKCRVDGGSRLSHVAALHPGTLFHDMPVSLTETTVKSQELFKKKWGKTPWERD